MGVYTYSKRAAKIAIKDMVANTSRVTSVDAEEVLPGLVSSVGVVGISGLYQLSRTACISAAAASGDLTL
jgi:hypothetical protein